MSASKRKAANVNSDSFGPRLFIKAGAKDDPTERVLKKLKEFDSKDKTDSIVALAKHSMLPSDLCRLFTIDTYYHNRSVAGYIGPENYIYWLLGLLQGKKEVIAEFNLRRSEFNAATLRGDEKGSLAILDQLENKSANWWAFENRIHIQKELLSQDTREAVSAIEKIIAPGQALHKARYLLLMSESSLVKHFTSIIIRQLDERRSSGNREAIAHGAILSCMLLPIYWDQKRVVDFEGLILYRNESLIDQYMLLKTTLIELVASGTEISPALVRRIKSLAKDVGDIELLSLFEIAEPGEFIKSMVEKYTAGDYEEVIRSIDAAVESGSNEVYGLIEIYAKAKIYCANTSEVSFFSKIANSLANILTLDESCPEQINYLQRICVKFRNELWARSLMFHLVSILSEIEDKEVVELSRKHTKCLGAFNTPKANCADFKTVVSNDPISKSMPLQRAIRYGVVAPTKLELVRTVFPIPADYLKVQSALYVKNAEWLNAINFLIREYSKNKHAFIHLPVNRICKEAAAMVKEDNDTFISCLIALDIYKREINSAYDEEKTELFEDWLAFNGTHKPSEIFAGKTLSERESYFLENICVPSQLDSIIQYKSNMSVIHERVTIINLLINSRDHELESLNIEKHKVIENLFSDKLRTKIETGKLYVDIQALEAQRKHAYVAMYEKAKLIDDILLENMESVSEKGISGDFFSVDKIEGVSLAISTNRKTDILLEIYAQAAQDFALNENFGLDKYLSAEIRHIVFVAQLRSSFEISNLMTTSENGEYLSNKYWMQEYEYVAAVVMDEVDVLLKEFSRSVDDILKRVSNQFRVGVDGNPELYIFDFSSYYENVVEISRIVKDSSSFEVFFRDLLDYMWTLCGEHAKTAQSLINDELKLKVIEQIDLLEQGLVAARRGTKLDRLTSEIKTARTNFNKEIETVLNWFRFVGSHGDESYQALSVVLEAAVASFISIYGHNGLIINSSSCDSELVLNFRESRALFISLFTALENSNKYRDGGAISVLHRRVDYGEIVEVVNVFDERAILDSSDFIARQKVKWSDASSKLSREEGGSGLYKINNLLSHASPGFRFDIRIQANQFFATMSLINENFISGR
ncbi:hypothetical protein DXT77_03375 [Pseudomonas sp. 91RF]|jgi:hypothetical protein|uniref:hypothetical protein n=1 Tax=Pseudomonas sp. 91RF TaxID=2292261 RepID=UPI000E660040|nr:hypothetical protein [Pseudomonas sp. 91RF]RIJ12525.1 hypothetical protein DXT77_03375 [Pseudomonas sp. 91RF]